MRTALRTLPILLAVAVIGFYAAPAAAFHDGGVAHCNGCHTMHNSENNATIVTVAPRAWASTPTC